MLGGAVVFSGAAANGRDSAQYLPLERSAPKRRRLKYATIPHDYRRAVGPRGVAPTFRGHPSPGRNRGWSRHLQGPFGEHQE